MPLIKFLLALVLMLIAMPLNPDGDDGDDDGDDGGGGDDDRSNRRDADDDDDGDDESLGDNGKKALEREREARRTADEKARKARDELNQLKAAQRKRDQEEGNYKTLSESLQSDLTTALERIEELESDLKDRDVTTWRERAARLHKIPDDLMDRIQGETEAEILADAEALSKHIAPPEVDDNDAGRTGNGGRPPRNRRSGEGDGDVDYGDPSYWGRPKR